MNYINIYNDLIAKCSGTDYGDNYTELHHIIPKCIGGTDDESNLVRMLPEQHYIAHLLLARIHDQPKLWLAANIMTRVAKNKGNKRFALIRRNVSAVQSDNIKEAWAKKRGFISYYDMAQKCWEVFTECKSKVKVAEILGFSAAQGAINWWVNANGLQPEFKRLIKEHRSNTSRAARMNETVEKRQARCKNMQDKFDSGRRSASKLGSKNAASMKVEYGGIVYDTVKEPRDKFQIKNRRWDIMKKNGEVKFL